jgi:hypothetical protein
MLVIIICAVVIFFVFVAMKPDTFSIQRSATFQASPEAVYEQLNSFRNWDDWSPWAKRDPNMKATFSGPEEGVDAHYAWEGNNAVGSGKMTILESQPNRLVKINLEFLKPFAATNLATFTITPEGSHTQLQWEMTGTNNFMSKLFGVIFNMDKTVGKDFEQGLASIKTIVEAG